MALSCLCSRRDPVFAHQKCSLAWSKSRYCPSLLVAKYSITLINICMTLSSFVTIYILWWWESCCGPFMAAMVYKTRVNATPQSHHLEYLRLIIPFTRYFTPLFHRSFHNLYRMSILVSLDILTLCIYFLIVLLIGINLPVVDLTWNCMI